MSINSHPDSTRVFSSSGDLSPARAAATSSNPRINRPTTLEGRDVSLVQAIWSDLEGKGEEGISMPTGVYSAKAATVWQNFNQGEVTSSFRKAN